jgi:tetratricopeptide (TPR) repeat protein
MPELSCISEADLRAFLLGQLPERVARVVSGHLETCPGCEARARELERHTDALVRAIRQAARPAVRAEDTSSGPGAAEPTDLAEPAPQQLAGYEVLSELGRGGMSVVYLARQVHPDRLVALKMILSGEHAHPERRARFRAEADAIARLAHPHIVQIHEIGEHDGLPFLSLEHLPGGSLARKLAGAPLPATQAAVLVEKLARAVHYAHEHGVVHRDLKPGNVLFDSHGEPRVCDFGLARHQRPELTATGAVLGTPSYMAPEQALGKGKEVGPPADVYALGAVLYECLTGRPPFLAESALDTLHQVVNAEPAPLRQLNPKIQPDLETVCLKCLDKAPARRYLSALELADDLGRWQRGESIRARPAGTGERALKWARRRPATAALLGVSVLAVLGLMTLSSVALWQWQNAVAALDSERKALKQAEDNLKLARQAVDGTFNVARDDPLFQQPRMERAKKLLLEKTLPFYRDFRAQSHDRGLQLDEAQQWFRVGYIQAALVETAEALAAYEKARDLFAEVVEVHPEVPQYQNDLASIHNNLGALLTAVGRRQEALTEYQRARDLRRQLRERHSRVPRYQNNLAGTYNNLGTLRRSLGQREQALKEFEQALDLHSKLVKAHPKQPAYQNDLAGTSDNLALLLAELGKREQALKQLEQALHLRRQLVKTYPHVLEYQSDLAGTHHHLGALLAKLGKGEQALAEYEQARDLQSKLVKDHPELPAYQHYLARTHSNLGTMLRSLGQRKQALAEYKEAGHLRRKLVKDHPRLPEYQQDLAHTHHHLGLLLADLGQRKQALAEYEQAGHLQRKLVKDHPGLPEYQNDLASTLNSLSVVLAELGKGEQALKTYEQARDLQRKLVETHSESSEYQNDLAHTHNNLGTLLRSLGKRKQALQEHGQALELQRKLAHTHRDLPAYQRDLAGTHNILGTLLADLGKHEQALMEYQQALDLQRNLAQAHPDLPAYQKVQALTHHNLGTLLADLGKPRQALKEYQQAHDIRSKLVKDHPERPDYQNDLAGTYHNLGMLRAALGQREMALKVYQQASNLRGQLVKAHPSVPQYLNDLARTHTNLGKLLAALGQREQALAEFGHAFDLQRKLISAHPDLPEYQKERARTHNELGNLLAMLGKPEQALKQCRQALELQRRLLSDHPDVPAYQVSLGGTYGNLGLLFREGGKVQESLMLYGEAIRLLQTARRHAPNNSTTRLFLRNSHWGRALCLTLLNRHREAVAQWDQAVHLDTGRSRFFFRLRRADSLARAGDYLRAAAEAEDLARAAALPGGMLYELGCIHAVNAASAGRDATRPLSERDKRAEEYARAAVALLRRAAATGNFRNQANVARVDSNADLSYLRDRADYQRFRTGLKPPG